MYYMKCRNKAFRVGTRRLRGIWRRTSRDGVAGDDESVRGAGYPTGECPTIYFTGKREIIR
jgi:hypothetical protein